MALSYALLMLPTGPDYDHDSVESLAPDLITWRGTLLSVIEQKNLTSWKAAFGDFAWSDLTSKQRFVLTWADPWDAALLERVLVAHYAMKLLKLVTPFHGAVRRISGAAHSIGPVKLESMSRHEAFNDIPRPLYVRQKDYFRSYRGPAGNAPWFDEWRQWVTDLDKIRTSIKPLILRNAIGSFERGLTHDDVDARIPEMVRAAEAIIALPRQGGGARLFVTRAMHFVASLANDPYFLSGGPPTLPQSHVAPGSQGQRFLRWYRRPQTTDLERWLAVLYGHRSDCVHGKVPFEELRHLGGGDSEAARFDWLAERLAREVVGYGLRSSNKWVEFQDRLRLEDAWRPTVGAQRMP